MEELILVYETDKPKRKKVKTAKTLANSIYEAWNYEEQVFTDKGQCVFSPLETIENNNDWLNEYGIGIKEVEGKYRLYNCKNNYIFENPYY